MYVRGERGREREREGRAEGDYKRGTNVSFVCTQAHVCLGLGAMSAYHTVHT